MIEEQWFAHHHPSWEFHTIMDNDGREVARTRFAKDSLSYHNEETAGLNANLLAAAPDLLRALKAIVAAYDGPTVDVGTAISSHIGKARAAIAKAGG